MKNLLEIKRAIKELRKVRRRLPREFGPEQVWAISWVLDYLEEDLSKTRLKNNR